MFYPLYSVTDAEEIGQTVGLLLLKFKECAPEQKCIFFSCNCFLFLLFYYFIYSLTTTPTNLRLTG